MPRRCLILLLSGLLVAGCGVIDAFKRPRYGVYVNTEMSQGQRSQPIRPDRFAYVTRTDQNQGQVAYNDPEPIFLEFALDSPAMRHGFAPRHNVVVEDGFQEVPAGDHVLTAKLNLRAERVERISRRINGVERFFETRKPVDPFPDPVQIPVTLTSGYVYEVALAGSVYRRLTLEVRRLNPANFDLTSRFNYVADGRKARGFEPTDADIDEVVFLRVLCEPCVEKRR